MSDAPPPAAPARDMTGITRAAFMSLTPLQRWIAAGLLAAFVIVLLMAVGGGGRQIIVNGQRLGAQEITYFDAAAGGRVPNGAYWFDPASGAFGRVGDISPRGALSPAGAAPQAPYAQQAPYGQSLDAQAPYASAPPQQAPHWGDVGQNDRGPFGDYMSDGQCSFVNGVAAGNC